MKRSNRRYRFRTFLPCSQDTCRVEAKLTTTRFAQKSDKPSRSRLSLACPRSPPQGRPQQIANFDPSLSIYDSAGSWFDSKRLKRIAYNDEPMWVFGRSTDARLTHRFAKSGTYALRVEAFAGQGGPDYSYQLKIAPGESKQETATAPSGWDERGWARRLDSNRLNQLAARGGKPSDQKSVETYRGSAEKALHSSCPARSKERWFNRAKHIGQDFVSTVLLTLPWNWRHRRHFLRSSIRSLVS